MCTTDPNMIMAVVSATWARPTGCQVVSHAARSEDLSSCSVAAGGATGVSGTGRS
jgi:hypothetical protein